MSMEKQLRIFIVSEDVYHTRRWIISLAERNYEIFLYSLGNISNAYLYDKYKNISCFGALCIDKNTFRGSIIKKIQYLKVLPQLRRKIKQFNPDILHCHYATSNGLLGVLSGFRPLVVSVWGSDVYEFPLKSVLHRLIFKFILNHANRILSTSHIMASEICKYVNKTVEVTPFGVDTKLYRKNDQHNKEFIIGNIKALEPVYAIDVLLRAFALIKEKNIERRIRLQIIGGGSQLANLIKLSKELGVDSHTDFLGIIDNLKLPAYYNNFSVFVTLSHAESFGVVAIEAMSCECPVVVSDVDGYKEVIENGKTGYIVERNNPAAAAEAIQKFIDNKYLREKIGKAGRQLVLEKYNWDDNVDKMCKIYNEVYNESINFS